MKLGPKIRTRRQELKLSLRELADRISLSTSFLSQIERDLNNPSVETLQKISEALDVPIFQFLVEPDEVNPVVRHDKRLKLTLPGTNLTYQLLTPDLNRQLELFLVELEPGSEHVAVRPPSHTEQCIYVLQGQLEIQIAEKTYYLGPGDSVTFEGLLLRRIAANGDLTVRYISAVTPPIF